MKGEEFFLKTRDGTELFVQSFFSEKKITIIALHGIAEHLGRHSYLPEILDDDFNVVLFDLRGHGRSQGLKGHVDSFDLYLNDLEDLILFLKKEKKMEQFCLFAHSMGALIAWAFLRKKNSFQKPNKVFLCSPPVLVPGRFGKLLPNVLLKSLLILPLKFWFPRPFSIKTLSHDPKVEQKIIKDELCFSSFSKQLLVGLANCSKENFSSIFEPTCPVAVATGSKDKVVYSPNVLNYFSKCGSRVKVKSFNGAYHELHNEIEHYRRPYLKFLREFFLE